MQRVAGSTSAKRAWAHLRGPYLLAYVTYLTFSLLAPPGPAENGGIWWAWVATVMGMLLVAGSVSSYMVVSHAEPRSFWKRAEFLEVTALRVIFGFEVIFAVWGFARDSFPNYVAILHLFIGLVFAGILSNLTWHKGKADATER